MTFTPNGIQVAVITVLVQEYRNGVLIGSTMRDIQIVVLNLAGCANPVPTFTGAISSTVQNGFYQSPSLVQVCPGNQLRFSTLAIEQSGDSIYVQSNVAQSIAGAQFTTSYFSQDSVFGVFQWTPTALDTGEHTFIVTLKNDNCPLSSNQAYAITIQVLAGTFAGPDLSYCPAGGPVQLQAYGGTSFTWSPSAGLDNPNAGNPLASPSQTTTYIVTSNLSSSCRNTDTVMVHRVPDFTYTLTQSEDTICRFEYVQLNAFPDSTYSAYTYQWNPTQKLNSGTIADPIAQPDYTTDYTVAITSDTGCTIRDSTLRIVVQGQGPLVNITADKYKVCVGDTILLNADISTLPCGLNVAPCQGNFVLKTVGTGVSNGNTPYNGLYEDSRMQVLFRASELQGLGMQAGTITDIAFDISQKSSSLPYSNFTIRMGCTELDELTGFVPGLSVTMVDTAFTPSGTGYNNHNFNTPYDWDGQSNLIVEICFDNASSSLPDRVNATNTGYSSVVFARTDRSSGCNLNAPAVVLLTDQLRPNVQFVYCNAPAKTVTYAWSPTNNMFDRDSLNPTIILNESTTYYLTANDGSCGGGGSVILNIDTSFGISAGPDVPFCAGVPVQINTQVTGIPPNGGSLNCGTNSTPCNISPVINTFSPPNASSSSITPFQGLFFSPLYEDQRTQVLYRASDLLAAGFRSGTINQIGLRITAKGSAFPFQNFNVKMGCTGKSELSDTAWEPTSLVYPAPLLGFASVAGWNDFALQNTFDWDGVSNLVIEICWDQPDGFPSSGQDAISAATVNYNSFHSGTAATALGCSLPASMAQMYQVIPEMRVRMCSSPTLPVTYQWTPSGGLSSDTAARPFASPSQPTTYYLTGYFGGTCPKYDTVVVTPQNFSYSLSNDTNICIGSSTLLSATGGNIYVWQPATYLSCNDCPQTVSTPDTSITYYVQITDTATGCLVNDSIVVTVQAFEATALFDSVRVDQGEPVTLGAVVSGGNGAHLYNWAPTDYLDNATAAAPVSTPLADIIYTLTVTSGPCEDTTSLRVYVNIIESPVVVPNAFTPNGDGKNDVFYPVFASAIATVKSFSIYNRYGELMHNSASGWDGKFKGTLQPAGTFVYYLVIARPFKDDEKLQGSVTLLH